MEPVSRLCASGIAAIFTKVKYYVFTLKTKEWDLMACLTWMWVLSKLELRDITYRSSSCVKVPVKKVTTQQVVVPGFLPGTQCECMSLLIALASVCPNGDTVPSGYNKIYGRRFHRAFQSGKTYAEAQKACNADKADLAVFESEQDYKSAMLLRRKTLEWLKEKKYLI